jgi:hypothetical protein
MSFKPIVVAAALMGGAALGFAGAAEAGSITYAGPVSSAYTFGIFNFPDTFDFTTYTDTGSGIDFHQPPDITNTIAAVDEMADFGGSNSDPLFPGHNFVFGADYTGSINAPVAGTYKFFLGSDDAGYLFIDGALIVARPGANGFSRSYGTATLTPGVHALEVQYDNSFCCGAGLQLGLGVPEPSSWALMTLGFGGLGAILRNTRRRQVLA